MQGELHVLQVCADVPSGADGWIDEKQWIQIVVPAMRQRHGDTATGHALRSLAHAMRGDDGDVEIELSVEAFKASL